MIIDAKNREINSSKIGNFSNKKTSFIPFEYITTIINTIPITKEIPNNLFLNMFFFKTDFVVTQLYEWNNWLLEIVTKAIV